MWTISPKEQYQKRVRRWPKKYRRELLAVHDNLDTYLGVLNGGTPFEQAKFGFIHPEPRGVLAIDQKGAGQGAIETRLYLYPEKETKTLHLIILGDKDTQPHDIEHCKEFVDDIAPQITQRQNITQPAKTLGASHAPR